MEAEISDQMSIRIIQQVFSALRKISNDVIIVVGENFFSIRALNSTKSALPVITFKPSFFKSFQFDSSHYDRSDGQQIVAQIQANAVTTAFKNAQGPSLVILRLKIDQDNNVRNQLSDNEFDENEAAKKNTSIYDKTFIISLVDKYSIMHTWEFPLSNAQVLNAMFDLNDTIAEVKCRYDILEGLSEYFKNINTIFLELNNSNTSNNNNNNNSVNNPKKGVILFKSSPILISTDESTYNHNNNDGSLTSTLSIFKSDRCEVTTYQADRGSNITQIAFSLFEFLVGLKIARNLNQYVTLHIIGPGQPLIMNASMPNVEFKMPLATINDENEYENENDFQNESENDIEDDYTSKRKSKELTKVKQENNDDQEYADFNTHYRNENNNSNQSDANNDDSQVTPWNFLNSANNDNNNYMVSKVKSEKQIPKVSFDSQDTSSFSYDKKTSRISQTFAQSLYEESPPFPSKRKFAGSNEIAQASQPMSDEEDDED